MMTSLIRFLCITLLCLMITACGGGGGDNLPVTSSSSHSFSSSKASSSSSQVSAYKIGGTVNGLSGSVILQNNDGDNLTVSADGSFTFDHTIIDGSMYVVTVLTEPAAQTCTVTNGGGSANADVNDIVVDCISNAPSTLSLSIQQTKTFHFSWTSVNGATGYKLMEDPTGNAGYTQVGSDLPANATSYNEIVPLYRRMNARYMVSACMNSACINSNIVNVSGSLAIAAGYVKASNTEPGDYFGHSVALSADGTTLAVTAIAEASNATGVDGDQANNTDDHSGALYVFVRNGSSWIQQAYIKASNTDVFDQFGTSIALSADGNTLAVGAIGESSSASGVDGDQANNSAGNSGAVYVFTRSGVIWTQQAYVKASNPDANDIFGFSAALSADGNLLVVGAPYEDSNASNINGNQANNTESGAGAVYVFIRSGSSWTQQAYIKASNAEADDNFGFSIALSADGSTLAVGANTESSNAIGINGDQTNDADAYAGAVYVFTRSGLSWAQQAYVKASNTSVAGFFGESVALSANGNTLAVGAGGESSQAIGIGGNQSDNTAKDAGAVYVFTRSGTNWMQQAYVKASNTDAEDGFGSSVALSADGNTLAVTAIGESSNADGINGDQANNADTDAGAAYVFVHSGSSWMQQAYIKASNAEADDNFGFSIALSADGSTLAVGAMNEASNATGMDGDQTNNTDVGAGAVYLY